MASNQSVGAARAVITRASEQLQRSQGVFAAVATNLQFVIGGRHVLFLEYLEEGPRCTRPGTAPGLGVDPHGNQPVGLLLTVIRTTVQRGGHELCPDWQCRCTAIFAPA